MIPDKKDILMKHSSSQHEYLASDILAAMDDYAKEVAIGFMEWKEQEGYVDYLDKADTFWRPMISDIKYSTDYLFNQYIQSLNKQP